MNDLATQTLGYLEGVHPLLPPVAGLGLLALVAWLGDVVVKSQLVRVVGRMTRNTEARWDDLLLEHRVFGRAAQVVPALIVYFGVGVVPGLAEALVTAIRNVALGYLILVATMTLSALLSAANSIYELTPRARERPIKGFLQVAQIVLYVLGAVLIIATLIEKSPLALLTGFGAMTAIVLLVFRDTILSLVASVQLTSQDLVRVGDWIEMPQYDADGDVIDVALHTVRVQNWDKTITTIPTHKLISESFRNWRGMSESGGRRIKRALYIDMTTVRFLTEEEIAHFERFALLKDYVAEKKAELAEYNASVDAPVDHEVNLRRLTNIGTFRAYLVSYLRHHPRIRQNMTQLVRQLQPGAGGIPIEIYAFTKTTDWNEYEAIQADIFDHVLAICEEFGLRVFQQPSGADFTRFNAALAESAAETGAHDAGRLHAASDARAS